MSGKEPFQSREIELIHISGVASHKWKRAWRRASTQQLSDESLESWQHSRDDSFLAGIRLSFRLVQAQIGSIGSGLRCIVK